MVTSVAVLVAMVKLVVRMVDFISLGRVRAKPYIGMTDFHRFYRTAVPAFPAQRKLASVIIHVSVMHCNVTRHVECSVNWTRHA